MDKNKNIPLILLISTATLFLGILIGTFIGRSEINANDPAQQILRTETVPSYTYPFRTNETGKVNINTATAEELTMLPGIGKETAERIVAFRAKYGIFYSLEELMNVKGISESTVIKLTPYATTGG